MGSYSRCRVSAVDRKLKRIIQTMTGRLMSFGYVESTTGRRMQWDAMLMPKFFDHDQQTPEWFLCRAGHATASRFKDILAGKKARELYLYELVAERLAGEAKRGFTSKSTDWGTQSEPEARKEYQIQTGDFVRQVGFAVHSRIKWVGASSDGLVGDDGAVEIKSPFNSGIHARTLAFGMPEGHEPQTQGNLFVLERKWISFCSYDPAFESPYNLFIQNFERDEKFIRHLEFEVKKFLADVNCAVRDIKNTYPKK